MHVSIFPQANANMAAILDFENLQPSNATSCLNLLTPRLPRINISVATSTFSGKRNVTALNTDYKL